MSRLRALVFGACAISLLAACDDGAKKGAEPTADASKQIAGPDKTRDPVPAPPAGESPSAAWSWSLPAGLTTPPDVPSDNPMSAEKVSLGHALFMDKRLSVDGSRSCYSCHQNHLGNADGRKTALGPGGKPLPRNTPTIWNVAYHPALYWEGRAPSLEKQAIGALKGGNMGLGDALEDKAAEIGALPEYAAKFASIFELPAGAKITSEHVAKALSAYERTLLCGDTPWDRQELSEAAARGQQLFMGKAACVTCHQGPAMSDGLFHITGIAVDPKAEDGDVGRFSVTQDEKDKFAFRTPTLRNAGKTAPYFHDGSVETLAEAVKLMAGGGKPQDGLTVDNLLVDRKLSDAEIGDLVAFIEHLECPQQLEVIGDQTADGIEPPPGA